MRGISVCSQACHSYFDRALQLVGDGGHGSTARWFLLAPGAREACAIISLDKRLLLVEASANEPRIAESQLKPAAFRKATKRQTTGHL